MKTLKELFPNKVVRYTAAVILGYLLFMGGTRVGERIGEALYYLTH